MYGIFWLESKFFFTKMAPYIVKYQVPDRYYIRKKILYYHRGLSQGGCLLVRFIELQVTIDKRCDDRILILCPESIIRYQAHLGQQVLSCPLICRHFLLHCIIDFKCFLRILATNSIRSWFSPPVSNNFLLPKSPVSFAEVSWTNVFWPPSICFSDTQT